MKINVVHVCRRPQWPLWAVLIVLGWLALGGVSVWLSSHLDRAVTLCLFKRVAGLPCLTCGFTRGALCLLRGRPDQTWLYNPLLFSVLALLIAATGIRILFGRSLRIRLTRIEHIVAWLAAAVLLIVNWVYVILYIG